MQELLHCMENSCTQSVAVYFSHIWLDVWILNYGFPGDALGF